MRRRGIRLVALVVAVALATTAVACSDDGGAQRSSATPARNASELTKSEVEYGVAPTTDGGVTYQPDVVLVRGGGDMVKGISDDGLTWTVDGGASGVSDLAVGKIFFITGRGVGRVLALKDVGGDKAVTLGPVDLAEVVKEASISYEEPLDLGSMFSYSFPNLPGAEATAPTLADAEAAEGADGAAPPTTANFAPNSVPNLGPNFAPVGPATPRVPVPEQTPGSTVAGGGPVAASGAPPASSNGGFTLQPYSGPSGIGLEIKYNQNGVKFFGRAVLRLAKPTLKFKLEIGDGTVKTAEIEIGGAAGITFEFEGGSSVGVNGNLNKQVQVPVDLSFPLPILGLPLAVTIRQQFILKTAFSAKDATLKATGDYGFAGSLGFGYSSSGGFGVRAPSQLTTRQSLLHSINGISIGVNGLVLAYQAKVIVGVGAFGFVAGPYFGLNASFGVTRGSDLGIVLCKGASLDIVGVVGLGYAMPKPITDGINFLLKQLNLGQIQGSGGIEQRRNLINKAGITPVSKICRE